MQKIVQKHPFGCGIACTAGILGLTYKKTLELFSNGKERVLTEGFYCKDIVQALSLAGFYYEYKYLKKGKGFDINKLGTIVYLRKSRLYPAGHYLARAENKWMDPWINFPSEPRIAGFRIRLPERPIYLIYSCTSPRI